MAVGFSVQIGRFLAAAFALFSGQIISMMNGHYNVACSAVALFYLVGIAATFFMPESSGEIPGIDPGEKTEGMHIEEKEPASVH